MTKTYEANSTRILADLATHGPSTPIEIAHRLGDPDSRRVWMWVVRMVRAGDLVMDPTGRIVHLLANDPQEQTT